MQRPHRVQSSTESCGIKVCPTASLVCPRPGVYEIAPGNIMSRVHENHVQVPGGLGRAARTERQEHVAACTKRDLGVPCVHAGQNTADRTTIALSLSLSSPSLQYSGPLSRASVERADTPHPVCCPSPPSCLVSPSPPPPSNPNRRAPCSPCPPIVFKMWSTRSKFAMGVAHWHAQPPPLLLPPAYAQPQAAFTT